ncbi:hypothetical protein RLOatenuis_5130 [Rickettsiales bacterium]|nr:hypothetical protein RLOatenuis_5130 [Rickettsiales bacterium]
MKDITEHRLKRNIARTGELFFTIAGGGFLSLELGAVYIFVTEAQKNSKNAKSLWKRGKKAKAVAKWCEAAFDAGFMTPVGTAGSLALAPFCGLQFAAEIGCHILAEKYDNKVQELKEEDSEHRSPEELGPEASQQQEGNVHNMPREENVPLPMELPSDSNNQPASCVAEAISKKDQGIHSGEPLVLYISTV